MTQNNLGDSLGDDVQLAKTMRVSRKFQLDSEFVFGNQSINQSINPHSAIPPLN